MENVNSNGTAKALKIFGAISIVAGFFIGVILGNVYPALEVTSYHTYTSFNWGIFLGVLFMFVFIGLLMIGIGEIIYALERIEKKTLAMSDITIPNDELPDL